MKFTNTLYTILIGLIIFLSSCKDFIEPSLENKKINLIAPSDSLETNIYNQSFWWEPVEDALSYRLQVVTPSFDKAARLIVDTLVKTNQFSITLDPGKYECRVRAENGSSKTLYNTHFFIIHESSIEGQQVQLKSPVDNFLTNQNAVTYKWESVYGSTKYKFQLDTITNNFADTTKLIDNKFTPNTELTNTFIKDGSYQWRIRAENNTKKSEWSAVYEITYDHTPPPKVVLISPDDNVSVSKPVSLQWGADSDAKEYELSVLKSDGSTYSSTFPITVTSTSYNFNGGVIGDKILWQVRARDKAGNLGVMSDRRSFVIQ